MLAGCDASEDADLERGRALFQQNCGTCHALAQAGTSAEVGPDLDAAFARARADGMDSDTIEGVVQKQIENPYDIKIPEDDPEYNRVFMQADLVTGQDAEDVSAYVASVAGVPGVRAPELPPQQLFTERCGSCHVLGAAGTSGQTCPDLDEVVAKESERYIQEQIVDPNSEITPGYQPNVMPADFEQTLSSKELKGLVAYLFKNSGNGGG